MDPETFDAVQPLLEKIAKLAEEQFEAEDFRRVIAALGNLVGKQRVASVSIVIDVFDENLACSLPLLTTGLSAIPGKEPFRTWGDSGAQRYVVADGIKVVPHDRCPRCWGRWDFKLQNPTCSHCGITLGGDCKLLLDTDVCPWCNEGAVTVAAPRCNKCGFEADRQKIVWG